MKEYWKKYESTEFFNTLVAMAGYDQYCCFLFNLVKIRNSNETLEFIQEFE